MTPHRTQPLPRGSKPLELPSDPASGPTFRSAAVARMANMPVATLRIWEQRYQAVRPTTAPSGHRLYSAADVQRVLLLRHLTERGHAIGSIATLDAAHLQQVSLASEGPPAVPGRGLTRPARGLRLVVVGPALAARLQRPAVVRHLARGPQRVAVFESLAEAARANAGTEADLLLWHAPQLQPEVPRELRAAQLACRAQQVAAVYRFAGSAAIRALNATGAATEREPADDESLGRWLASVEAGLAALAVQTPSVESPRPQSVAGTTAAPRRYDDAALTAIAGLSSTLACECPRHVAELLMQLSSFEAYSAACIDRTPADAALHAYLQQVAGTARALFESALERVARHEGLPLR